MRPLAAPDFSEAAALLHEGFPHRPQAFWAAVLNRLLDWGGNAQAEHPLGFLMTHDQRAVGIALTPASLRRRADGSQQRIVNLSSWYVRPEFRWRAGLMLRGILSDEHTIYTDLTPTPEVQRLLPMLGLQPMNRGVAIHLLPLLGLHPARGASLRELAPGERWPHAGPSTELLEAHRSFGCLPLVLCTPGREHLVVVQRSRLRGLPAARLVYADSQQLLLRHAGVLARHLVARGLLLWVRSTRVAAHSATSVFRPRELWFARGGCFDDRTDVLGSELCLILPPRC
jgi:hypothetical protein